MPFMITTMLNKRKLCGTIFADARYNTTKGHDAGRRHNTQRFVEGIFHEPNILDDVINVFGETPHNEYDTNSAKDLPLFTPHKTQNLALSNTAHNHDGRTDVLLPLMKA